MRRLGVLSSRNHPLLPYLLDRLERLRGVDPVLIFDAKEFSTKDTRIFTERTGGAFPPRGIDGLLDRYQWTTVPDHNSPECRAYIEANRIALVANGGTPRILRQELLSAVELGVVNAHPGVLPKYRGASCCEWAIYNDEPVGVTAHFMDAGLDSGPIILTRELPIQKGQTYADVRVALYRLAQEVLVEAVQIVYEQELSPARLAPQPAGSPFKPIPDDLLDIVRTKLARGEYRYAV